MRQKLILLLMLSVSCSLALSSDMQRQDQLVWDFAEFTEQFSARNWHQLERFIRPDTKAGLGGEMGFEGVLQVFGEDDDCHNAMVQALQMGCRKTGEGDDMRCVSPPQLGPGVVYVGARASFHFDVEAEIWTAELLICGGD